MYSIKAFTNAFIPYGGYYSTPFCRWQMSMQYDNAAFLGPQTARRLSADPSVEVQIVSYGYARVKPAFMPAAPVPAAQMALDSAGLKVIDMEAIKTHNPFATNDINLAKKMGIHVMKFNNYGSSLIYGHPQGPTAGRGIIEMIEELAIVGGGYGLFTGCAAGDTAAAIILRVG